MAELLAMFKNEPEILFINEKGKRTEVEITNAIRQAQYDYVYEDRNSLIDRRQKFQEAFSLLNAAGQNPELAQMVDWKEALKTGLEMTGFDNPDKFFKPDDEITQVADYVRQLPPELQQAIMQNLQPMLQQAQVLMEGMNEERNQANVSPMVEG